MACSEMREVITVLLELQFTLRRTNMQGAFNPTMITDLMSTSRLQTSFVTDTKYLVVSDIHPRSVLKDQCYPGEIVQRVRQSSDAAASTDVLPYQAPMSTSQRREERATTAIADQSSSASAVVYVIHSLCHLERMMKPETKSPLPREELGDEAIPVAASPSPERVVEEEVIFEGEADVEEVKLSAEEVRRVLAGAQEEVLIEREEESKKRQKERAREEREETKAKKAKEVHEWLNSAPAKASGSDIRIIQASLQEAFEAGGPTSVYHFEVDHDNFGEPVPVYRPLSSLPFRIMTRLKELGFKDEDSWCYNLQSGFARTFEYATHYCGRAQFLMELIEGLEKTQDAYAYREVLQRYRSNLKKFFPRYNEWQKWIKTDVEDSCHSPTFVVQWLGLYVREIWLQLDAEDLVASEHYRPGISSTQPHVAPSVNERRTPGLHLLFDTVEEVTVETVMVVPLYLLGIFKSWAEQMQWHELPSRVMDVYKHLHARFATWLSCYRCGFNSEMVFVQIPLEKMNF
eukprot:4541381-Amphidinium_carterae.1